jgi:hypothetical protein
VKIFVIFHAICWSFSVICTTGAAIAWYGHTIQDGAMMLGFGAVFALLAIGIGPVAMFHPE